jgi:hypothetical protein
MTKAKGSRKVWHMVINMPGNDISVPCGLGEDTPFCGTADPKKVTCKRCLRCLAQRKKVKRG